MIDFVPVVPWRRGDDDEDDDDGGRDGDGDGRKQCKKRGLLSV